MMRQNPAVDGRRRRRVFSLRFQAGAVVLFIHWRVAAERRGVAGDFLFMERGRRWPRRLS